MRERRLQCIAGKSRYRGVRRVCEQHGIARGSGRDVEPDFDGAFRMGMRDLVATEEQQLHRTPMYV